MKNTTHFCRTTYLGCGCEERMRCMCGVNNLRVRELPEKCWYCANKQTKPGAAVGAVDRTAAIEHALTQAIVGVTLHENYNTLITEADDKSSLTKQEVERIVRKSLDKELDSAVVKLLKRELKTDSFEKVVVDLVCRTMAAYHEIMFTRKSTWMNQLRK